MCSTDGLDMSSNHGVARQIKTVEASQPGLFPSSYVKSEKMKEQLGHSIQEFVGHVQNSVQP